MRKKNLTLVEIAIVVVVIGILATIGIPVYNNIIENAKARACELNLKTILGAVEAQTLEEDSFPASLSKISDKNFEKAWAKVLKKEGAFKTRLVYFLVNFDKKGLVYAATTTNKPWVHKFISDSGVLRCPCVREGNSYGINASLAGKTYEEYKTGPADTIIVGDCNSNKFSSIGELDSRHRQYGLLQVNNYAMTINKSHKKVKIPGSSSSHGNNNNSGQSHGH